MIFSEPKNVNVTKRVHVNSHTECAHHCRTEKWCEAFKYRGTNDDINCQIIEGELEFTAAPETVVKDDWTLYTLHSSELVRTCQVFNGRIITKYY